ncbi:MAG: helix-turn-helix domain-containing protein [Candidatus Jordarchaeales archaeon]
MIHMVYVIDEKSGINLLFRKYGELEMDEVLMSGFLTAIKHFSSEFKKDEPDTIQEIEMKTYKIVYASDKGILVAAVSNYDDSTPIIRKALLTLASRFSEEYGKILKSWHGDTSIFSEFTAEIDKILMDGRVGEGVKRPKLKTKLMTSMVRMGFISEKAFRVGELCDGKRTKETIADELGMPIEEVIEAIRELERKKLIEWR